MIRYIYGFAAYTRPISFPLLHLDAPQSFIRLSFSFIEPHHHHMTETENGGGTDKISEMAVSEITGSYQIPSNLILPRIDSENHSMQTNEMCVLVHL